MSTTPEVLEAHRPPGGTIIVDPPSSWQAGWNAARADNHDAERRAFIRGLHAHEPAPFPYLDCGVIATITFCAGFILAVIVTGGSA